MLAGKMCLLRSYHLRSTTFVTFGSSLTPSSCAIGLELLGFAPGLARGLKSFSAR